MAPYTTFYSIFVLSALQELHVYCATTCVGANQICSENPECCQVPVKSSTILQPPELVAVIVSVLIFAIILVGIMIFICSRCGKARKEALSPPPEYIYPPASPSVLYSETSEYAPRPNPYHANKEWQDRRAWSMTS